MAEWNDNVKHQKSSINQGQQYTKDNNVSIESLNNTIENAFYAARVAEDAQSATNNAVSYNVQTPLATEQTQAQKNLGINQQVAFAESERQKSKNLLNSKNIIQDRQGNSCLDISNLVIGKQYTFSTNIPIEWFKISNAADGYVSVEKLSPDGLYDFTFTMTKSSDIPDADTQHLYLGNHSYQIYTAEELSSRDLQIEEGNVATNYQSFHGEIVHSGDAPVVFSEEERQKSKNLLPYPYYDGNSKTINGITFTANSDGSIAISGTATANASFLITKNLNLVAGAYHFNFYTAYNVGLSNDKFTMYIAHNGTETYFGASQYNKLPSITNGMLEIVIKTGATVNDTYYPQLEEGSSFTGFQPYNGAIVHKKDIANQETTENKTDNLSTINSTLYPSMTALSDANKGNIRYGFSGETLDDLLNWVKDSAPPGYYHFFWSHGSVHGVEVMKASSEYAHVKIVIYFVPSVQINILTAGEWSGWKDILTS